MWKKVKLTDGSADSAPKFEDSILQTLTIELNCYSLLSSNSRAPLKCLIRVEDKHICVLLCCCQKHFV